MDFKKAFKLVFNIHDQCGDRDGWCNCRDRLKNDAQDYVSFEEWENRLSSRSDISDDERWDLECFNSSIEVLFALMGKF